MRIICPPPRRLHKRRASDCALQTDRCARPALRIALDAAHRGQLQDAQLEALEAEADSELTEQHATIA